MTKPRISANPWLVALSHHILKATDAPGLSANCKSFFLVFSEKQAPDFFNPGLFLLVNIFDGVKPLLVCRFLTRDRPHIQDKGDPPC